MKNNKEIKKLVKNAIIIFVIMTTVLGIGIVYFEKFKNDKPSSTQNVANQ